PKSSAFGFCPRLPSRSRSLGICLSLFKGTVARTALLSTTLSEASALAAETPAFMRPITKTHHSFWLLSKDGDQDGSRPCGATMGCILNGRKMSGDPWAEYAPV